MHSNQKFIKYREGFMKGLFLFCSLFCVLSLITIIVFLFANGVPFIAKVGFVNFIFGTEYTPLTTPAKFGILPLIVSSIYVTIISVILAVAIGLFTSACLHKFVNKKAAGFLRQLVSLLAGIPSVIFGLFGIIFIVPIIRDYISPNGVGYGIMSASIVLTMMILPTIVNVSLDALEAVPNTYYEGALALGTSKEEALFRVLFPSAKSGIFAGIILSIGRAIGETMAVIMVIGGSNEMPNSLFQSVNTLTANIAAGALELTGDAERALVSCGVVLFVFTLLINILFIFIKKISKGEYKK